MLLSGAAQHGQRGPWVGGHRLVVGHGRHEGGEQAELVPLLGRRERGAGPDLARVGIDEGEEFDGGAVLLQPAGQGVGEVAAERPAEQPVGPLGLYAADLRQHPAEHLLHVPRDRAVLDEAGRLEAVEGEVAGQVRGEARVAPGESGRGVDAEQRARVGAGAQRQQHLVVVLLPGPPEGVQDARNGGGVEQGAQGDPYVQHGADPAQQPHREEGVPPEVEEAVLDSDRGHPEHLGEQAAQRGLLRGAGQCAGGLRPDDRGRQGAPVQFAVGGERQFGQLDEEGGDHVLGQRLCGPPAYRTDVQCRAVHRHRVGHEPLVTGAVLPGQHHRLAHLWVALDDRLDLTRLDTEAPDLHLVVDAAHELQLAVGVPAHQVSGAVHPLAGRAERVRHEPLRGHPGPARVAACQARSPDVQLTDRAGRHELETGVEHVGLHVAQEPADRGPAAAESVGRVDDGDRHVVRALGGAVDVGERDAGVPGEPAVDEVGRQLLAVDEEVPQPLEQADGGVVEVPHVQDRAQHLRHDLEEGDALVGDAADEQQRIAGGVLVEDVHPPADQRHRQRLPHGDVEGERRVEGHRVVLVETVELGHGEQVVGQAAVGDQDALGPPGRARREHRVREQARTGREVRPPPRARPVRYVVDRDHGDTVEAARGDRLRAPAQFRGGHQAARGAVREHLPGPVDGQGAVQGQISAAGAERAERGGDEPGATVGEDRGEIVGAGTRRRQGAGDAVGGVCELTVGVAGAPVGHGDRVRPLVRPVADAPGEVDRGLGPVRAVPLDELAVLFGGGQHGHLADAQRRVGGDRLEESYEPVGHGPDGRLVEHVRGVFEGGVQPGGPAVVVAPVVEVDGEAELRGVGRLAQHGGLDTGQPQCLAGPSLVEREHHLEQGVPVGRASGVEHLDEPVERDVLVGVGVEVRLADPAQQLPERGVAGGVGAQHDGVDEESDEVVQGRVGASGHRGAEGDVGAGPGTGEQHGDGRLEHHEQRAPVLLGDLQEASVQLRPEGAVDGGAAEGVGAGQPHPVERQRQFFRQSRQRLLPVGELTVDQAVGIVVGAEQVTLPQGVVGVLDRQRLPGRGEPVVPCAVGGAEVAQQRGEGPAVAHHVVHDQSEHVVVGRHPQQPGPDRQVGSEVEGAPHHLVQIRVEPLRPAVEDGQDQTGLRRRQHPLIGRSPGLAEHGPQALVPVDDIGDGSLQSGHVQRAAQPHHHRHVVRRPRPFQPVQEPQPLLCERQGEHAHSSPCRATGRSTTAVMSGASASGGRPLPPGFAPGRPRHRPRWGHRGSAAARSPCR